MKVVYFPRTNGACDWYRVQSPLRVAAENTKGLHHFKEMASYELSSAIERDDSDRLLKVLTADVLVVPRLWGYEAFQKIKAVNSKAKIVLEYDDDMFNVSPFSPHYADHGLEEVSIKQGTQILHLWEDGKNIHLANNHKMSDGTRQAMREADLLTCTGEDLATRLREENPNVAILPNCVDLDVWKPLPLRPRAGLRFGWFGGSSHYEDWLVMAECLPEFMRRHPEVTLVLMGMKFDGTLKGIPKDRIEFHPWVETAAYPYKAAILDLDAAVIPLRHTPFNKCKSPIKWVEMAALSIPSVVSNVPPYSHVATEGNGIWIENNDPGAWLEGLSLMATDTALRKRMGYEAYHTVRKNFDISKKWPLWIQAYEGVLNGRTYAAHKV